MIEKETNELRTVKRSIETEWTSYGETTKGGMTSHHKGRVEVVVAVQRKWLVESGPQYSPTFNGPPDNKQDLFVAVIDGRAIFQPMKEEWRDLPSVEESN